jgi:type 1 glutamine amidotransferase
MTKPQALIISGGWEGHDPAGIAQAFAEIIDQHGLAVQIAHDLAVLDDPQFLTDMRVMVPVWTGGELSKTRAENISAAVAAGTAMAGCHGGMCSAFHGCKKWSFITGGVFIEHPGDILDYRVTVRDREHPIMRGISDFAITTEQYYMHIDPAVHVLATTRFPSPGGAGPHESNGPVDMPVVWTKYWGRGRIFYTSIGHDLQVLMADPHGTILRRGIAWALGDINPEGTSREAQRATTAWQES